MAEVLTPERWERIKNVFHETLLLDYHARESYLNSICGDDSLVRSQVERLIAHHGSASGFLEEPISAAARVAGAMAWRPTMFSAGDVVNGRFRIVRFIGKGGMGEVYEAVDEGIDGAHVALKTIRSGMEIDEDLEAQFRREVLIARQITHPNVCRIYDLFDCPVDDPVLGGKRTVVFLTMELLTGESLAERLARLGPMSRHEALPFVRNIVQALDAAHRQGVIHRDLKASNVMLVSSRDGGLKGVLTDFGLARMESPSQEADPAQTRVMGTPDYMAPEQLGHGEAGFAADIFSLGVVLYEMVTGRRPFPASSTLTGAARRADSKPVPPRDYLPNLDSRWQNVIMRCLELEPSDRFASAQELLAELEGRTRASRIARRTLLASGVAASAALFTWLWDSRRRSGAEQVSSLAVLPFQNLSGDSELEYFAEALTDDLIPMLTRLHGVRVVALGSSSQLKGTTDLKVIGKRLNVATVLTGGIRKQGMRITVTAQLTNLADGLWLWSGAYEEDAKTLPRIRVNLCLAIAGALQPRLPAAQLAGIAGPQSDNAEAYNLYLLGKHQATYRTDAGVKLGIDYLMESVARDPNFALAYAALSEDYNILAGRPDCPPQVYLAKAEEAALRALQLDPKSGEAHISLGSSYQRFRWDWQAAEREFLIAIRSNPGLALAHYRYSGLLSDLERHEQAIRELLIAKDLDPLSPIVNSAYGEFLCRARRYSEALSQLQTTVRTFPDFANARRGLAEAYGAMGRWNEAVAEYRKALEMRNSYYLYESGLGHALARAGYPAEALAIAKSLEAELGKTHYSATSIAYVYRGLDDADKAFYWFDIAVQQHDPMIAWIKADPANDRLRADPRFSKLLERLRL